MTGSDCTTEELLLSMRLYSIWVESQESKAGRWVEVARECIRQMEWAREGYLAEYADEANEPMDFARGHLRANNKLTAAPDDWTPS